MKTLIAMLSLAAALATAAPASASTASASTASASTASRVGSGSVVPGSFSLYEKPGTDPSPECDVHVQLQLINGFASPVATLHTAVQGICEVQVDQAPKVFNLTEGPYACGSRRYVGGDFTSTGEAGVVIGVEVIDNRARTCRKGVEAMVVVNETYGDGSVITFYSNGNR